MGSLQHVLVIYDIPDDRIRQKISAACLDYGLDRVQFSAFEGRLQRAHQKELMRKVRDLLGRAAGKIQLIPISAEQWEQRLEVIHE